MKKSLNLFLLCAGIAFLFINFQPAGAAETQGEILQIKNLRIEKVSGENFPAVITAYYDFGTKCEKFKNLESSKGEAITCSVSGNALYTINIDKKTKLLLGNGREANLADFKTANLINLFGVLDLNTFSIKALIIRNTDNPQIKRLIQMNNLEVASEPKINTTPQKFNAGQKYTAACITSGSAGDAPISCPYGIEIEEINNATSSVLSGIKYSFLPIKRKYSVEIKPGAKILRKDFKPIKFGDIQKGDVVNIYGVDKGLRRIEAVTIRDLSVPKSKKGIIRAVATDEDVKCPEAEEKFSLPCGILYGANIQLLGSDGKVIKSNTTKKGDAIFENIPFGDYEILATASGYRKGREFVSVNEEAGVYPVSVTLRNSKKAVDPIIISASST
ncbi:carboxypeptidase regulatory-like domain-containing protein, partial [Candidatus Wolfebacteria bacterium]|nr:carboxypeptidase regulatory-like domain-containing protein [Candidatus Wolfebacteria bacterium]